MAVHLTIENEASLPDGGPLTYSISGKRGIDIGRDAYLDWCLPDPTRTVSGKHCEIRYRDGGYWLHDVSRNGTFLNRSASRLQEPHRLRDGDRIEIGRYMILVRIDGEEASPEPGGGFAAPPAAPAEYWGSAHDAAPPISPKDLRPARESRPVQADFREWAIDVPAPSAGFDPFAPVPPPAGGRPPSAEEMSWAQGPAAPPASPDPYLPVPNPRRPSPAPAGGSPWDIPDVTPGPGAASWPVAGAPAPAPAPVDWAVPGFPASNPAGAWPAAPPAPVPDHGAEAPGWAMPTGPGPSPAPSAPAAPSTENPWGRPSLSPDRDPRPSEGASAPPQASLPPAMATEIPPPPAPARAPSAEATDFVARFAKGAGMSPEVLGWRDPGDLAEELGVLMRLTTESLKQLLSARAETKRVARAGGHTMIQALDNNPLKFSPTVDDALKIILGKPASGYLDARRATEQSFKDLKVHQVKTYSAMQHALRLLMEDLDPAAIEESTEGDRGIGALLGSKKAKLWDLYVARWDTLTSPHEDGMVDAFMMFFAECYDRGGGKS